MHERVGQEMGGTEVHAGRAPKLGMCVLWGEKRKQVASREGAVM